MRMRSRTVHPEFYKNVELYEAEMAHGLPLRLAYEGLWGMADREGRFEWKPRVLKLDILPFDTVDFEEVLDALACAGFVIRYEVGGKLYGWVKNLLNWQKIHPDEAKSKLPPPPDTPPEISGEPIQPKPKRERRVTPRRSRKNQIVALNPIKSPEIPENPSESFPTSTSTSASASTSTLRSIAPNGALNGHKASRGPPTWLTPYGDLWTAGEPPFGVMASVLKPLIDGHSDGECLRRFARYLKATEPKYWSMHRFKATWNLWESDPVPGGIADEPLLEYVD